MEYTDSLLEREEQEIFAQSRASAVELFEAHGIDVKFSDTPLDLIFKIGEDDRAVFARISHNPTSSTIHATFSYQDKGAVTAPIPLYPQSKEALQVTAWTNPVWQSDRNTQIDALEEKTYIQGMLQQLTKEAHKGMMVGDGNEDYSFAWFVSYTILPSISELAHRNETFAEYIKRHTESIL
ncbi:MAG TPA: hypothetical protein PLY16_00935 [Candidatus Saccharibacteria bacterium]|nr:hypothetical protein [Candidatus Saccharibacteria bacterium]